MGTEKTEKIVGKLVFAVCGMGASVQVLFDNGDVEELPIHRRDFDKCGGLMYKQVVWKHEYGRMPTITGVA